MIKKRKPMDDAMAQFVFGKTPELDTEPPPQSEALIPSPPELEATPPTPPAPKPTKKEPDFMSKLQAPEKEPTVRFTVDMSESLHRKLSMLAARTGRKKVDIVRVLLEEGLKDVEE
ncbi:MAG: CopG family transcriptional regulator [Actinomycetota bacterium]